MVAFEVQLVTNYNTIAYHFLSAMTATSTMTATSGAEKGVVAVPIKHKCVAADAASSDSELATWSLIMREVFTHFQAASHEDKSDQAIG